MAGGSQDEGREQVAAWPAGSRVVTSVASHLNDVWVSADAEAAQRKDSQHALEVRVRFFEGIEGSDRDEAEAALSDWVFSTDPRRQFDALATIERLEVRSALPAVRRLADEFERSTSASAPYD